MTDRTVLAILNEEEDRLIHLPVREPNKWKAVVYEAIRNAERPLLASEVTNYIRIHHSYMTKKASWKACVASQLSKFCDKIQQAGNKPSKWTIKTNHTYTDPTFEEDATRIIQQFLNPDLNPDDRRSKSPLSAEIERLGRTED